jgi:tRNA pseudouridine55 synthase
MSLFGVLNINKSAGRTSRDVVNRVQRFVRPTKVGHAGTLDPLADGVLLVLVGQATRLTEYAHQLPKQYRATFLLGQQSPTHDVEVEPEIIPDAPRPTRDAIEAALPALLGRIKQLPPAYSAVKIKGQRAYDLARRGEQVEISPRTVTVHALRMTAYQYPQLDLEIECGSGTYIRSLGRDLARSLGTQAVMAALTRTAIGPFAVTNAIEDSAVDEQTTEHHLQPPQSLLPGLKHRTLTDDEVAEIGFGRPIDARDSSEGVELAGIDAGGRLIAILRRKPEGRLWPVRTF